MDLAAHERTLDFQPISLASILSSIYSKDSALLHFRNQGFPSLQSGESFFFFILSKNLMILLLEPVALFEKKKIGSMEVNFQSTPMIESIQDASTIMYICSCGPYQYC